MWFLAWKSCICHKDMSVFLSFIQRLFTTCESIIITTVLEQTYVQKPNPVKIGLKKTMEACREECNKKITCQGISDSQGKFIPSHWSWCVSSLNPEWWQNKAWREHGAEQGLISVVRKVWTCLLALEASSGALTLQEVSGRNTAMEWCGRTWGGGKQGLQVHSGSTEGSDDKGLNKSGLQG